MIDDTHPQQDIPEPPQSRHEKRRKAAGWQQKAVLVLIGLVAGAALVAGGYALAGNHSASLAPLQGQVRTLQAQVRTLQAQEYALQALVTGDAGKIAGDEVTISQLTGEYGLLKIEGITTYDESCPIGGVWVPCGKKEPPGFGRQASPGTALAGAAGTWA